MMNTRTLIATLTASALAAGSATATLQFHEPFDYADDFLRTGSAGPQGSSALGAASDWNTDEFYRGDMWVHPEGSTVGILIDAVNTNEFNGVVANLPTSGGFLGPAGQSDVGLAIADGEFSRNATADIALAPSITNSFQTGNTTWVSFVTAQSWDRNEEMPNVTLGSIAFPGQSRGDNYGGIGTGGDGFGTGGGPNRNDRNSIYPMHYRTGQYHNIQGAIPGNSYAGDPLTDVPDPDDMPWEPFTEGGTFGEVSIVVMKIEWNADTGGEDIQSVVRFDDDDVISEAAFDALIAAQPGLSTENWAAANKPNIDETQLNTLTFGGIKYFIDEIRIATTFDSVVGGGAPQIPGDTDNDGDIDDADLGTSFSNYTGPLAPGVGGKTLADGDTDGDGDVDDADLGTSFSGYTGPLTSAVPEPTSLALLGLGGLLAMRRRRA